MPVPPPALPPPSPPPPSVPPTDFVHALVDLYEHTNGALWTNNTNWLQGEPCVNAWHGVTCCPETHPTLLLDDMCYQEGTETGARTFQAPDLAWPDGCHSGSISGTSFDLAKCVVARVDLSNNNLVGPLNESLRQLNFLLRLILDNNGLTGFIPAAVRALASCPPCFPWPAAGVART